MTIQDVITNVDNTKPNMFDEGIKLVWLNEVDNKVYQIMKKRKGAEELIKPDINAECDYDMQLLLPDEFSCIYTYYLYAMIDFSNNETQRYNNSMIMYDNALDEFEKYWYREHPQISSGTYRKQV